MGEARLSIVAGQRGTCQMYGLVEYGRETEVDKAGEIEKYFSTGWEAGRWRIKFVQWEDR